MAINQKNVALNACSKITLQVANILEALDKLEGISEQLNRANINLANYDADISAAEGLQHATGTTYQIVAIEAAAEIVRALKAYDSVLTPSIKGWTALQRIRR